MSAHIIKNSRFMGIGQSTLVSAPAPTKPPDVLREDNIHTNFTPEITLESFKEQVTAAKDKHSAVMLTFETVKSRIASSDTIELREKTALDRMKEEFGDGDDDKKAHIEMLYNINAIYDEYVPESKEADKRKVKVFEDFDVGYARYIDMLGLILDTKEIAMDDAALVDKSISGLKEDSENARKVINQYLTRIMYLNYCLVHNDYVSMIYTMFAVRLFRTFDVRSIVSKKRNEFKGIVDKLLVDLNSKIGNIKKEHADMIEHSDKSTSRMLEKVKNMTPTTGGTGGAETAPAPAPAPAPDQSQTIYEDILALNRDKFNMYTLSNKFLKTYIDMINDILVSKLNEISELMKQAKSRNVVVSEHLQSALTEIKKNSELLDEKGAAKLNLWGKSARFGEPLSAKDAQEFDKYMKRTDTFAKMTPEEQTQYKVWLADMMLRREYDKLTSEIANISTNTLGQIDKNPSGVDMTAREATVDVEKSSAADPTVVSNPVYNQTVVSNPQYKQKNKKPFKP